MHPPKSHASQHYLHPITCALFSPLYAPCIPRSTRLIKTFPHPKTPLASSAIRRPKSTQKCPKTPPSFPSKRGLLSYACMTISLRANVARAYMHSPAFPPSLHLLRLHVDSLARGHHLHRFPIKRPLLNRPVDPRGKFSIASCWSASPPFGTMPLRVLLPCFSMHAIESDGTAMARGGEAGADGP